ncbi:MAG: hypothetical protein KY447_03690 [Actinobacteria bacterium]|nr:hypothetical protein [Actinomycetota bacterium]
MTPVASPTPSRLSRRTLLLAGAGGLLVSACGGGGELDPSTSTTSAGEAGKGLSLAKVFFPQQPAGVEVRLPLALADARGVLLDDGPPELNVGIGSADTGGLGEATTVRRHAEGIPRAYYPLTTTLPTPGNWRIATEVDGEPAEMVVAALEPSQVPVVPVVGEPLISVPTPTVDDPRGVDPVCTAAPPCPLHGVSLDAAIGGDKAIAMLIATPAYCQTAICGPVLDLLVARQPDFADAITMIHVEVYPNRQSAGRTTTDAVRAYGLAWEPSLFLARADGTIASRLDYTYDVAELDAALTALVQ